jgi:hypothetical protein
MLKIIIKKIHNALIELPLKNKKKSSLSECKKKWVALQIRIQSYSTNWIYGDILIVVMKGRVYN